MIEIREATENDLIQMLEIYNDIIVNTTAVWDHLPHTLEMRQQWFADKKKTGYPVFVAFDADQIVGFSTFGPFRSWSGYRFTVENSVYVKTDCRGNGIGKMLLPPLIEAAKKLQLHAIVAGIDATNKVSIGLHKKFGFEEVAHFKQVGFKFDRWLDLIFLELIVE
jgi:L-amino acid N-acyltransferase